MQAFFDIEDQRLFTYSQMKVVKSATFSSNSSF